MGRKRLTAKSADRHALYQTAVQCPEADVEFFDKVFRRKRNRRPLLLREDFCGTAALCREWVESHKSRQAIGVDLDEETLAWGRRHNVDPLGSAGGRIELIKGDVLKVRSDPADILVAFNFSYCLFKERRQLVKYFRRARASLAEGGMFMVDVHGGPEATEVMKDDPKKFPGFTYVWDQASYNPIDGHQACHIHFKFPDGTKMRRAFSYEWRHYGLPEVKDMLIDAGFTNVEVYWEGTDEETGEGDGVYELATEVEDEPSWIVYVVAEG